MYNLLVSFDDAAWESDHYILDTTRFCEYTDTDLVKRFGELDDATVSELLRFPCIFAYETSNNKPPKFGVIRKIVKRRAEIRIDYEIIERENFLTPHDLLDLAFELDISKWEMNRTHWAIKDINLAKELKVKGISLPNWVRDVAKAVDITTHIFDVALSFPGEIRPYIEQIAEALEKNIGPNSYFYDNNYVSQLARPSLDLLLQDIYSNRSKLVVVFLGGDYQQKEWCGVEFRAIKEIIMERQNERIMFVKVDDIPVEGVFKTDGYIDSRKYTPQDIAHFIEERVRLILQSEADSSAKQAKLKKTSK